jgi:PIN domain nuclease of toxin-antitoxin system
VELSGAGSAGAPLTHEIALATRAVRLPHRDPADRFLVATALIHGLTLVTADQNVGRSKQIPVLLNGSHRHRL